MHMAATASRFDYISLGRKRELVGPRAGFFVLCWGSSLPVQRFDAAEGGRLNADPLKRYAHVMPVIDDRNGAVYVVVAAARSSRRVRRRLAQLVRVLPINLYYEIAPAVVREVSIEGPAEPGAPFRVDILLTPAVDLYRRIAVVVGLEVIRQLRERRVAQEQLEIVIGARFVLAPGEVTLPLPLRYLTRGYGVG